ncbi:MAG: hypothetical protein ACKO96_45800 [Flammeovirgaceae bacterium]
MVFGFLLNVVAIQGWIFAIIYLTSAVKCRMEKTFLTQDVVKYLGWGTGCAYLAGQIIISLTMIITFPGDKYTADG